MGWIETVVGPLPLRGLWGAGVQHTGEAPASGGTTQGQGRAGLVGGCHRPKLRVPNRMC